MKLKLATELAPRDFWRLYHQAIEDGDIGFALKIARLGIHFHETHGDLRHAGIWRRALGNTLFLRGHYPWAVAQYLRAAEMQPDSYEKALALVAVGGCLNHADRSTEALGVFKRATVLAAKHPGDWYLWTHFLGARAFAFMRTGNRKKALQDWERAAAMFLEAKQHWRAAANMNNVGFLLTLLGKLDDAEQRLWEALTLLETDPHPATKASIYDSLGYVFVHKRDQLNAHRYFKKAAELFEEIENWSELFATLLRYSEAYEMRRNFFKARQKATYALKLARELEDEDREEEAKERLRELCEAEFLEELSRAPRPIPARPSTTRRKRNRHRER